jgi:uncharacterized protein (DUF1800 family)
MDSRLRALNRFGLGARVGERDRITDTRGWLRAQLDRGAPTMRVPDLASANEIADALRALRMVAQGDPRARQEARRRLIQIATAENRASLTQRVTTERPFIERLVAFWSNHLCVSASAKLLVAPLAGSYEREVIRPHVLGRFEDMVLASAQHPAMLFYLDNFQSIGPNSRGARFGRRAGAQRGLNENYARELLELHTLGVAGGYTQQDVVELARILTGWTVSGIGSGGGGRRRMLQREPDGPIRFAFQELLHEPGTKTVLGVRYKEDGVKEGERVIRALCQHPATAKFVATKLVTHFVADQPPAAAIDRVASAFRESDGDLRVTANALIDLPEVWSDNTRKFRTPQDWLVAVLRAFNAPETNDTLTPVLRQLRHPLWAPQAPKGFGDTTPEWADPDSLMNRAELARTIARRVVNRDVDPRGLLDVVDLADSDPLRTLLADNSIPADERVALAIAGPAFQWR